MGTVEQQPYRAKSTRTYNTVTKEISYAVIVKWEKGQPYKSLVVDENGVKYFTTEELAQKFANKLNESLGVKPINLPHEFFVSCSKKDKNKIMRIFKELDIDPEPDFENIWYNHVNGFYIKNFEYHLSHLDDDDNDTPVEVFTIKDLKLRIKVSEENI